MTGDDDLTEAVGAAGRAAGLAAVGVAPAERFESTRRDLFERRSAGLHGGMAFTYRNPERSTDPDRVLSGARSLVVGAYGYLRPAEAGADGQVIPGWVARYARRDHYADLRRGLAAAAAVLCRAGYSTVVVADDNALVDREAARRAGLGWYGRNANLLLPGRGSWFVLGTVVTDAPLVPTAPVDPGCGGCTRCLGACPTDAIVAPGVVDARRCLAWLLQATGPFPRELRTALGARMYGCDDCQEVCPPNIAAERQTPEPGAVPDPVTVEAADFLQEDDDAVLAAAGRWYVPQREARYLRRNALVVLGNAADPDDARALALLTRSLKHDDPLVRAHAVWACARLGRSDLADGLEATEADPMVREELDGRAGVPSRAAR
ncbi:MAG TPA: tRNA epoxyqueuosine(34) reductase QueG [Acidimicrobiales bacterium]